MAYEELKSRVCEANRHIVRAGLVLLTWGNVSGVDRGTGVLVIKPSGVSYDALRPEHMVVVSLHTGETMEGALRPSSDTPIHRALYLDFPHIAGIVHTHSTYATCFAQARREIPCLGTTHADHFHGAIPVTRELDHKEIQTAYEWHTGRVIAECFRERAMSAEEVPGVLVAGHGPFAWGGSIEAGVENAVVLEAAARMNFITQLLNPAIEPLEQALLDKHFSRKHGAGAYYGQSQGAPMTDEQH